MYPALREYRLSVVRLGVLHSGKYLGIFEESRVPKKTVYSVGRRDLSRESERTRTRAWSSHRPDVFRRQSNTPGIVHVGKKKYTKRGCTRFIRNVTAPLCVFRARFTARAKSGSIARSLISVTRTTELLDVGFAILHNYS